MRTIKRKVVSLNQNKHNALEKLCYAYASEKGHWLEKLRDWKYQALLGTLFDGYLQGLPEGASDINAARASMRDGTDSLSAAAQTVADAGLLVQFDPLADPRFAPLEGPP